MITAEQFFIFSGIAAIFLALIALFWTVIAVWIRSLLDDYAMNKKIAHYAMDNIRPDRRDVAATDRALHELHNDVVVGQ